MSIASEMYLLGYAARLRRQRENEEFAEQTRRDHPELRGSVVVTPNGDLIEI